MSKNYWFMTSQGLNIAWSNGAISTVSRTDNNFETYLALAMADDWDRLNALRDGLLPIFRRNTDLSFKNGKLQANDKDIVSENVDAVNRILSLLQKKGVTEDASILKPFVRNCVLNPYINCVQELYDFCKHMDFEIDKDGCILAYKIVRPDMTSYHDAKTKHIIGEPLEVKNFDIDRSVHCSTGLHFCSREYLKSFGESDGIVLVVKVNPKDIVSIPNDHSYTKGRCRRYIPVKILGTRAEVFNEHITLANSSSKYEHITRKDVYVAIRNSDTWVEVAYRLGVPSKKVAKRLALKHSIILKPRNCYK